jgi:sn-glycerol 3-phosphate transport system substrate-binding protein
LSKEDSLLGAWDYLKYLATPEVSAKWFMNTGYYPMNTKAMELAETKEFMVKNPQFNIINKISGNSKNYKKYLEPWIPSFTDVDRIVQDEIIRFSKGSQDLDKTIINIDSKSKQMLNDWRQANPQ